MAISPAFDFATTLSAGMAGIAPQEYVDNQKFALDNLDKIEQAISGKIKSDEDFARMLTFKSALSSLYCYTSNNKLPEFDRVSKLEGQLGNKMHKWTLRGLAPSDDNLLIRYILWNRRYVGDTETRKKILDELIAKGYIFIRPAGRHNDEEIVVTGIYCKVGDNVFSRDRSGREHRQYVDVCVQQCFKLTWEIDLEYVKTKDLQVLEKDLTMTWMGDGKGCARHPKITRKDSDRLRKWLF